MGIKISASEVLIGCSCPLFITGSPLVGAVFLGLGVTGSIMRFAMEAHEKKQKVEMVKEILAMLVGSVSTLSESLNGISTSIDRSVSQAAADGSIFN